MNELLKEALTSIVVIPIAVVLLRYIFGRSIMFKISLPIVILMIFIAFISSNAASSEELASSADELSEQAKQLKELISFFKSQSLSKEIE